MDIRDRQNRQQWGFTFFGEAPETSQEQENIAEIAQESPEENQQLNPASTNEASFPLAMAAVGDRLQIIKLTAGEGTARRLLGMGLNLGVEVQVISKTASNSVIIAIQDNRIGLGVGMAHKVIVTPKKSWDSSPDKLSAFLEEEQKLKLEKKYLRDLAVGSIGRVVNYEQTAGAYRKKLLAMGLTKGTEFTVTRIAPLGDPVEIQVRGFHLSLRKQEADALWVEELPNSEDF